MNKFNDPSEEDFEMVCEVVETMVEAAPDLMLARSREEEERVINGVKALVDATMDPPKDQSETLANNIQRSMSEVIELAFRRAEISEAITGDLWRGPRVRRHHQKSDIERIAAMIRINTSVRVNERTQYRISKNSIGPLIRETYEDSSSIAQGTFEIRTISRRTADGEKVSLESVITFTASRTQYREFLLSMHLMQLHGSQGATVMPATIIMHEKISYNHPIFQAIIQGNYETFMKLIDDKRARIWDRDPEGRSLLVYAITFGQVDMVRYLIRHGMDVNDRGKSVSNELLPMIFERASPNMYSILTDAEYRAETSGLQDPDEHRHLHDLFEIQRLLLEAGFDPQQELAVNCCSSLDSVIRAGTYVALKCFLDQSQYTIFLSEEHFTLCTEQSYIDTWTKMRLLYSRGAMRNFKGNMRSHIFKCTLRRFNVLHRYSDLAQTLDSLLASKVKDSTKHHEQVDLDDQVQLVTKDFDDAEYDLCELLQDVTKIHYGRSTAKEDLLYCAVRRALLRNDRYRDWMRRHPRKPSIYCSDECSVYTPFHHLSWLRQKSPMLCNRGACPFGSHERVSQVRDHGDWKERFSMGEWPEMTPQEESIIAHGALVERWRYHDDQEWVEVLRWSPQGEIRVRIKLLSCPDLPPEQQFQQTCDWSSNDCNSCAHDVSSPPNEPHWREVSPSDSSQDSDADDSNSGEVSSPLEECDWKVVFKRSEPLQLRDAHAQDLELARGHYDQYLPHPAQLNQLQDMHDGFEHGYPAPMATKRRLSTTTELQDVAEGWKRPRLDLQHLQSFGRTPQIASGSGFPSIADQGAWVPVSHAFREYSAPSGLSNTVGVDWDQANVLPDLDPWFHEKLDEGMIDEWAMEGMMDEVVIDMMNEGVMDKGMVNEGLAPEESTIEELNIEELIVGKTTVEEMDGNEHV
ncbi:hypothetical protein KCU78_g2631, partial [Aureobasidium melanogenum]